MLANKHLQSTSAAELLTCSAVKAANAYATEPTQKEVRIHEK